MNRKKDYETLAEYYPDTPIDSQTRDDLTVDSFIDSFSKNETSMGLNYFCLLLRNPVLNRDEYNKRKKEIESLKNIRNKKDSFRKIGFQERGNLIKEIWEPENYNLKKYKIFLYTWMILMLLVALVSVFINSAIVLALVGMFLINAVVYLKTRNTVNRHTGNINYLLRILNALPGFISENRKNENQDIQRLALLSDKLKKIRSLQFYIKPVGGTIIQDFNSILLDYIKIFLMLEIYSFITIYDYFLQFNKELKEFYLLTGKIECFYKIDLAVKNRTVCDPQFHDRKDNRISFKALYHPLVENAVSNTLEIDRSIILTGTNMAGKSTFLRTLGLNQLLAQTLLIAFAEEYSTSFYHIKSSINSVDSLSKGMSKYYTEAVRLKNIIDETNPGSVPYLVLIDEILSGTNSQDRIKMSIAVLKFLNRSAYIISATHDLEIAETLKTKFDNYHFIETVAEDKIEFDYKIKNGIVHRKNAVRLLKQIGFPRQIMDELET